MQLGLQIKNKLIYPLGYIFLFFSFIDLYGDRIDQYYQMYQTLEKYQQLLIETFKAKNLKNNSSSCDDQLEVSIKTTSSFVTSCINLSTLSKQSSRAAQGNIILQVVLTAYAMCISFAEIIKYKKEEKKIVQNMTYTDMVVKFPHIVLIDYQLKIIKLLLDMNSSQIVSERAFARIHLITLILPKPYDGISKKLAKKIYKKYFNQKGDLISLLESNEEKEYKKFFKNISVHWQELVLNSQKFSTDFSLFDKSEYKDVPQRPMNKKIMQMIEAARSNDIQKLYELKPNVLEITLVELYDFLIKQIDSFKKESN